MSDLLAEELTDKLKMPFRALDVSNYPVNVLNGWANEEKVKNEIQQAFAGIKQAAGSSENSRGLLFIREIGELTDFGNGVHSHRNTDSSREQMLYKSTLFPIVQEITVAPANIAIVMQVAPEQLELMDPALRARFNIIIDLESEGK